MYVRNPQWWRLHVGFSNCGAKRAILLYSNGESVSAKRCSFIGTDNASSPKSYSLASKKHLITTGMEGPRIVRLAIPSATAPMSTWITRPFPLYMEAQCRATCSTTRIPCALMSSLPLAMERGITIENAESGSGCPLLWLR